MKASNISSMIRFILVLVTLPGALAFSQSLDQNFVRSDEVLVPTTDEASIDNLPVGSRKTDIGYTDSWGRPVQVVGLHQSPAEADFMQITRYDAFNRTPRAFLPFAKEGNDGAFLQNAEFEQKQFYQGTARIPQSNYPFADVAYDGSPLNREVQKGAPGSAWQLNANHTVDMSYVLNSAAGHPVRQWVINGGTATALTDYVEGALQGVALNDEDGKIRYEFSDKRGNKVYQKIRNLRIEYDAQNLPYAVEEWLETYWVYDAYGHLHYAIPPKAVSWMSDQGSWDLSTIPEDLVFSYSYDKRGRLVEKHVPGGGDTQIVYDNLDRPVMTQGAAQAGRNEWEFVKYDELGRPVLSGLLSTPSSYSRISMQSLIDAGTYPLFEKRTPTNFSTWKGYTQNAFPVPSLGNYELLTVTWYDDYDFNRDGNPDISYLNDPDGAFSNEYSNRLRGQITGVESKVLAPSGVTVPTNWTSSVSFYDSYGRTIQNRATNHLGYEDISWMDYDFAGKLLESKSIHAYNQAGEVIVKNSLRYDHAQRLIKVYQQNNEDPQVLVLEKAYNEAGQVIEENVHSTDNGGSFLQSMDYGYHIRGWLNQINDPDLVNEQAHQQGNWQSSTLRITIHELSNAQGQNGLYATLVLGRQQVLEGEPVGQIENMTETSLLMIEDTMVVDSGYLQLRSIVGANLQPDVSGLSLQAEHLSQSLATLHAAVQAALLAEGVGNEEARDEVSLMAQNWVGSQHNGYYVNDDPNDLFGMELRYDRGLVPLEGDPRYNGHISGITWKSASDGQKRGYGFQYDDVGRLQKAEFAAFDPGLQSWSLESDHFSVPEISYDFNGNILSLERQGWLQSNSFGQMDALSYTYVGNRLQSVNDAAVGTGYNDFSDNGSNAPVEFSYDASGNTLNDANKGINVVYNHLNKPVSIDFGGGKSLLWVYNAAGTKLRKIARESGQADVIRDYVDGFEYQDGELAFFACEKGRVVPTPSRRNDFRYEYYYTDHLGNTRLGFSDLDGDGSVDETEIIQEMHYYPYGLTMSGLGTPQIGVEHRYGYNGAELQNENGLTWWDTHYRSLDPQLGRWMGVDPKADERETPFMAMAGDPIRFMDALGDTIKFGEGVSQEFINLFYESVIYSMTSQENIDFWEKMHTMEATIVIYDGRSEKTPDALREKFKDSGPVFMPSAGNSVLGTILWSPYGWIHPKNQIGYSSPAINLFHEGIHAMHWVENPGKFIEDYLTKPGDYDSYLKLYDNCEEYYTIGRERTVSNRYYPIEMARKSHYGSLFFQDIAPYDRRAVPLLYTQPPEVMRQLLGKIETWKKITLNN